MESYSLSQMIKDVWKYVKPYRLKFWLAVFLRASSDIVNLLPAYFFSTITTILTDPNILNKWDITFPILIYWVLAVLYFRLAHDTSKYFGHTLSRHAALDAKFKALRHAYDLDLDWHEKENSGNKIKRIDNAGVAIKELIQMVFNLLIENIVSIVGVSMIFFTVDKTITLVILLYIVVFFFVSKSLSKKVSKKYKPISKEEEVYEGLSFESINNIRTVKSLNLYDSVSSNIKKSLDDLKEFFRKFILMTRIRNNILDSITRVMEYIIMFYLVYRISNGLEAIGTLILFRSLFWKVIEAIWEFTDVYNDLLIYKNYLTRFNKLMTEKPTIERQKNQIDFPSNWDEISIKDLSFSYGDKPVLKNLNLNIKRGEQIGIVGISGAGKSTFVKLMLDLYENYTGSISFNGKSLKEIRRADYMNYVSNVSQDTELFNDTLINNICIGLPLSGGVTEDEVNKVIRIANLQDVVSKLPKGLETVIGEKGFKLSGGERQRVGIARAIIRNPQLIIFDEATSHLDSDSEQKIQSSLDEVLSNVSAIVIAHRLSTLKKMDRILVLSDGEVIEQGSLNQLLDKKGLFFEFWNKQNWLNI